MGQEYHHLGEDFLQLFGQQCVTGKGNQRESYFGSRRDRRPPDSLAPNSKVEKVDESSRLEESVLVKDTESLFVFKSI